MNSQSPRPQQQPQFLQRKAYYHFLQHQPIPFDLQQKDLRMYSGVVRGEWKRQGKSKLQSICYGSGIAISKRVVLTCAHSVYLEKKRKICNSVSFIVSHRSGKLRDDERVYKSAEIEFIRLEEIGADQTFSKYPIPEDLALVFLEEDLPFDSFPDVGLEDTRQILIDREILVSGYPSLEYYACSDLIQAAFEREDLCGKLVDVSGCTIYHDLPTSIGHSGSGLIGKSLKTQRNTVVGVHTHKGKHKNSGVYLNTDLLKRLARYEMEFALNHPEYIPEINFPEIIKKFACAELSQEDHRRIFRKQPQISCNKNQLKRQLKLQKPQQQKYKQCSSKEKQIQQLICLNQSLKNQLLLCKKNQQTIYKWLSLQNSFLRALNTINKANASTYHQQRIRSLLYIFTDDMGNTIKQLKQKINRIDSLEITYSKFPTVSQHLQRCTNLAYESEHSNEDSYDQFLSNKELKISIRQKETKDKVSKASTLISYDIQRKQLKILEPLASKQVN